MEGPMTAQEYSDMISRERIAFLEEAKRHRFQYFGCLGTKSIIQYSSDPNIKRHRTNWTAQELYSEKMPRFLRQVAKANQGPVTYLFSIEHGKNGERPHIHFQLGGVAKVSLNSLRRIWTEGMQGGRAEIHYFDSLRESGYTYKDIIGQAAFGSGIDHEQLWDTNVWKRGRTHNSPTQAHLFERFRVAA